MKQVWSAHLSEECAIKLNNIRAVTASHYYIKVHQKLLLFFFIHCRPNSLKEEEWQRLYHLHAITVSSDPPLEKRARDPKPQAEQATPKACSNTL